MIRYIIIIFTIFSFLGCSKRDTKYKDFINGWERYNLCGKVKCIETFKGNYKDSQGKELDRFKIEKGIKFTEFGSISKMVNFNNFGDTISILTNRYNKKGLNTNSKSKDFQMPSESEEQKLYNDKGKIYYVKVTFNDTIELIATFDYDSQGNPINQLQIQNGDTSKSELKYVYDIKGNILQKKQINYAPKDTSENLTIYNYNENGNIIETVITADYIKGKLKTLYNYDKRYRIKKVSMFDENGVLEKETIYDKWYNSLIIKNYRDGKIYNELKNKYHFDKHKNWIKKDVSIREYYTDSDKFVPIYQEKREIEYF